MATPSRLTPAQREALLHVARRSRGAPIDRTLRVTLNFHPDRERDGVPILAAMGECGLYRSQFETGTSNGGLTAHPGGDRWGWESRMFGSAYDGEPPASRPKYGSLNFRRRDVGGSPRFGSAHFRLTADSLHRTTFCYPDSVLEPVHFGVASAMALTELAGSDDQDFLDDYVEAHLHGDLRFDSDVEAIVLDPCFRLTEIEELAASLPCATEWHSGFRVHLSRIEGHPDYRGEQYVRLARELAEDGWLDPSMLGRAARTGRYDEQELKRVWHYVARFGWRGAPPRRQ